MLNPPYYINGNKGNAKSVKTRNELQIPKPNLSELADEKLKTSFKKNSLYPKCGDLLK